ncbi:MAG: hypothetical protein CM15mV8_1040 [Caudoviricetes sp.]|nr:MAG: hypothetical protein CM15mV8_1040 [Caudoviricetes sp.]
MRRLRFSETQKEKFNKLVKKLTIKTQKILSKLRQLRVLFGKKESTSEIDDVAAESSQDNLI